MFVQRLVLMVLIAVQFNCGAQGTCADPPEMPLHVAPWQYVLTILSVLTGAHMLHMLS